MKQTIEEMKTAIEAFERDGKILVYTSNEYVQETETPTWNFSVFRYLSIKKEKLKMPVLGSKWKSINSPWFEAIVSQVNQSLDMVWMGQNSNGVKLDDFYVRFEPLKD